MKKQVYLAGAIEKAPDGGVTWRRNITQPLLDMGLKVFDPCVEVDGALAKYLGWEEFDFTKWQTLKQTDSDKVNKAAKWIVVEDLKAIRKSDMLLVYYDEYVTQGAGTYGEMTLARFLDIPVYLVLADNLSRDDIRVWVNGCKTQVFESFNEVLAFLEENHG